MDLRIKNLFKNTEDPRVDRTNKHPLDSILYIVLCGTMAGARRPNMPRGQRDRMASGTAQLARTHQHCGCGI